MEEEEKRVRKKEERNRERAAGGGGFFLFFFFARDFLSSTKVPRPSRAVALVIFSRSAPILVLEEHLCRFASAARAMKPV